MCDTYVYTIYVYCYTYYIILLCLLCIHTYFTYVLYIHLVTVQYLGMYVYTQHASVCVLLVDVHVNQMRVCVCVHACMRHVHVCM